MEESGFELVEEGKWTDIVEFCRAISEALEAASVEGNDGFEAWRPKEGEARSAMRERTVEGESLGETRVEAESEGFRTEMSRAGGHAVNSGAELVGGNARDSVREVGEAGKSTGRGLFPMLAKLVRSLERGIYRHLVQPTNPDYFEASAFSASIERQLFRGGAYRASITFTDEAVREDVRDRLEQ